METYGAESGIAVTCVRVSNFRSLSDIEVRLNDLTVLIGANNAGKTSFLDALFAAIGAGRRSLISDDVRLAPGEAAAPKDRRVAIDLQVCPVGDDGSIADTFPAGSFWTSLWGNNIILDETNFSESMAFRTTLAWSEAKGDYQVERRYLKEWRPFADWIDAAVHDRQPNFRELEPIAFHYVDAMRDLSEDLRKPGSFWRRLTEDLGLDEADVAAMEESLSTINQAIVDKSEILQHLKDNLASLQSVVAADSGGIDISPVARKLRDLSKGVDVSFSTTGAQAFPLARHGIGTRSLASLLVFRAYASWRNKKATIGGDKVHSLLALEEPESHLHPQAQRSLFAHIKDIPGQLVVSTHSPYFAGQARLEDLRLFIKRGGDTIATALDLSQLESANDKRKLQETVIESRGDILFARAVVLFEGQTEEQSLPIWAQAYWGASIHELGFSFVRANGTDYFPFIWLAKSLAIPWYVFADGEAQPVVKLEAALKRAGEKEAMECGNVIVIPDGRNFETQLVSEDYQLEIEAALDACHETQGALDAFMEKHDGKPYPKNNGNRDYKSEGGRERALLDAMRDEKVKLAKHLARAVTECPDPSRRFPSQIERLFQVLCENHAIAKAVEVAG